MTEALKAKRNETRKMKRRLEAAAAAAADRPNSLANALKASQAGISISTDINSDLTEIWSNSPSGRGRPKANVFETYQRKKGVASNGSRCGIAMRRSIILALHKALKSQDKNRPCSTQLMRSHRARDKQLKTWTVHFAAELAWITMGHRTLESIANRPVHLKNKERFVDETYALWKFLNDQIERTKTRTRGRKPNAEKLFKLAVSTYVAKKLILPNGGNASVKPQPREISQVWYVLFGELEPHDSIKKRLGPLHDYLKHFPLQTAPSFSRQWNHYHKLIKPLNSYK